jgi:hypothetical protein
VAVAAIAIGAAVLSNQRQPLSRPNQDGIDSGTTNQLVMAGGLLHAASLTFPIDPETISVGQSNVGYVATVGGGSLNTATFLSSTGTLVASSATVRGIALTAPDSGLAAWVGPADPQIPDGDRRLYVADAATGAVTATVSVPPFAEVMAVHGATVALSDDDQSWLYTAAGGLQQQSYIQNEFYIQDFNDDVVVASDLSGQLVVVSRSGAQVGSASGLLSATLSPDGTKIGGIDDTGKAYARSASGANTTEVALGGSDEVYGVEWSSNGQVQVRSPSSTSQGDVEVSESCNASNGSCQTSSVSDIDPLVANNAFGQILIDAD